MNAMRAFSAKALFPGLTRLGHAPAQAMHRLALASEALESFSVPPLWMNAELGASVLDLGADPLGPLGREATATARSTPSQDSPNATAFPQFQRPTSQRSSSSAKGEGAPPSSIPLKDLMARHWAPSFDASSTRANEATGGHAARVAEGDTTERKEREYPSAPRTQAARPLLPLSASAAMDSRAEAPVGISQDDPHAHQGSPRPDAGAKRGASQLAASLAPAPNTAASGRNDQENLWSRGPEPSLSAGAAEKSEPYNPLVASRSRLGQLLQTLGAAQTNQRWGSAPNQAAISEANSPLDPPRSVKWPSPSSILPSPIRSTPTESSGGVTPLRPDAKHIAESPRSPSANRVGGAPPIGAEIETAARSHASEAEPTGLRRLAQLGEALISKPERGAAMPLAGELPQNEALVDQEELRRRLERLLAAEARLHGINVEEGPW